MIPLRAYDTPGILQHSASRHGARTSPRWPRAARSASGWISSSARPRKRSRDPRPTSRVPLSTVRCGRRTGRTVFSARVWFVWTSGNLRRISDLKPTTRKTITTFLARIFSIFCPTTTRVCVCRCKPTTRSRSTTCSRNGIQQTEDFNNFKSNQFAAVLAPGKTISWTVNYYFGQEQPDGGLPDGPNGWFRVFDTYSHVRAVRQDVLRVRRQPDDQSTAVKDRPGALVGTAGYARYQITPPERGVLEIRATLMIPAACSAASTEAAGSDARCQHKVADGFLARGEFRRDWSNQNVLSGARWTDAKGQTRLVGLVWWFGGKQGPW